MLDIKILEVRDRCTCIMVIATKTVAYDPIEKSMLEHAGYDTTYGSVILTNLETGNSSNDPYKWESDNRTMFEAHRYIERNWNEIPNHWVVDVEYILSETEVMKLPSRYYKRDSIKFQMIPPPMSVTNGGQDYDPDEQFDRIIKSLRGRTSDPVEFEVDNSEYTISFKPEELSKYGLRIYPSIANHELKEIWR